jgi:type VI secretion system protein ImpG
LRREPRIVSERQRRLGARSSYIGSEVFIALVDPESAPYKDDIRQIAVTGWVTNRDLPLLLPSSHEESLVPERVTRSKAEDAKPPPALWRLDAAGPVQRVDCLRGPTRPVQRLPRGEIGWSLVSLLTLNHLSIAGVDPPGAAAALRSMLLLFGPEQNAAWKRMVEGLVAVRASAVTRRLPGAGRLTFGSGIDVQLDVDELAFQGGSAFMLGSVLERFLARHAAINSYTETTLRSSTRGLIKRWAPRSGAGPLL